jgi:hypothetical protein
MPEYKCVVCRDLYEAQAAPSSLSERICFNCLKAIGPPTASKPLRDDTKALFGWNEEAVTNATVPPVINAPTTPLVEIDIPERTNDELRHDLAVLQYCLRRLHELTETDSIHAWLWELKAKVAVGCIAMVQSGLPDDIQSASALTEEQEEELEKTHPLLHCSEPDQTELRHESSEWIRDIRNKVSLYAHKTD